MGTCASMIDEARTPETGLSEVVRKRHSLLDLPDDILLGIYNCLEPTDRVSFKLSSHRLWAIAPDLEEGMDMYPDDWFKVLQLFERRGVYPKRILCTLCEDFHRPRLTNGWNAKQATRACVQSGDGEIYGKTTCNLFPTYVHFDLVAAITRSWRHNLGVYSPQLLQSTTHSTHPTARAQVSCDIYAEVIDGRLIVKIEKILFTGHELARALKGPPHLAWLWMRDDGAGRCCPHVRWAELHPFVFDSRNRNKTERRKFNCLWGHAGTCWANQKSRPQPSRCLGEVRPALSKIWGCHRCYTDMTISYQYIKSRDIKLVTLTAWKDLGHGVSIDDPAWESHTVAQEASSRQCDVGSLYHLFEGKWGEKAPIPYMPELGETIFAGSHEELPVSFTT